MDIVAFLNDVILTHKMSAACWIPAPSDNFLLIKLYAYVIVQKENI